MEGGLGSKDCRSDIVVFGESGQVGGAFKEILGENAVYLDTKDADFSRPQDLSKFLTEINTEKTRIIVNTAAYTAVDRAEEEEGLAYKINAESPGEIAKFCAENNIVFVHYSTDYVFDGSGEIPWKEGNKPAPLNAYGRTKLAGEEKVAAAGGKYLIFRTSWVYDHKGKNFLNTMLRLGREREELKIVDDQVGAPTYAGHIAKYTLEVLSSFTSDDNGFPSGIYNLCNSGHTSWCGFANKILETAREGDRGKGTELKIRNVVPIPTSEFPTPAIRPLNSRLDLEKLDQTFGIIMPSWEEGLRECMERL